MPLNCQQKDPPLDRASSVSVWLWVFFLGGGVGEERGGKFLAGNFFPASATVEQTFLVLLLRSIVVVFVRVLLSNCYED